MDDYCLKCHQDAYQGWFHSAHHFSSFNNKPYLFSVRETRQVSLKRDGNVKASRWCAGCHDVVPFLSGGFDDPNSSKRRDFIPVKFTPRQNPFYCALPYNDKAASGHRPEAPRVVPWFKDAYQGPGVSVCKGRWIAIRKGNKIAYAQWEDAGPFRTDHWQYVFGNERPKPNLNKGAGLDVSPAVRDYLGINETDVTDWQFVDFKDVPRGPWSKHGENNTFVIEDREEATRTAQAKRGAVSEPTPAAE